MAQKAHRTYIPQKHIEYVLVYMAQKARHIWHKKDIQHMAQKAHTIQKAHIAQKAHGTHVAQKAHRTCMAHMAQKAHRTCMAHMAQKAHTGRSFNWAMGMGITRRPSDPPPKLFSIFGGEMGLF